MVKKLLMFFMLFALAVPLWAGEKTVTISRNEGLYDDGTGVYYCTKGGITMTFSSGLNNVNYLVEHQQVVFDIFSTNYVIKKIKFNCLDNTTDGNLDCFYWGPSTISEYTGSPYTPTGSYTYSGFIGTWVGGSTPSKYVKFVTMAKPVRFGSVEITYDKEFGDIYEKVTTNAEIEDGQTYVLVSQNASKALGKEDYYGSDNLTTFTSTPVTLLDNNNKVKVTDEVQLMKLEASGNSSRPWYIKVGDNYMRRRSSLSGSDSGAAYGQGYNLLSASSVTSYEQYFRVSISVSGNTNQNALIRFDHNSSETSGGKTFAIRHYNGGSLFRDMDYSSNNQYAANQRVYLYKPAESFEVTTECIPGNGGYITLGDGILTDAQGKNWSQHFDNVTFFVGPTEGWGVGAVTLTDVNSKAVTTLTPTNTSDFGNDYSFEMPANDVKITANFLQPYNIDTICTPNANAGEFNFISGYTDFNGQYRSNEGKTVTFQPTAADDYILTSVTYYDSATGETTTLTPDANGVYTFTMPGNGVTLTANFEQAADLYLLGTANGGDWAPSGPKFIYDAQSGEYYLDVYYKGNVNTSDPYGHFSLTKRISDNWNDIANYRLVAQYNDYDVWDGQSADLYKTSEGANPNYAFRIPAGVYRITVNQAMTQVSISEYPLTVTFDPVSGTIVESGDEVSFTSNLNDLVHAINNQEDQATYSSTDNWGVQASGNTHTITHEGVTTVTGQSSIGYITATGTADYEIIGDLYLLGTANGGYWAPTGPQFTYDADAEEYYIDVYFKGGNVEQGVDPAYGYFSLTTQVGNDWNAIAAYRLAAEYNNYGVADGSTGVALYSGNNYINNAFKIPAGVYRITVNKAKTEMSITEYPLTLTFDPVSGTPVDAGDHVTITSNIDQLVHAINPNEISATIQYATSTDGSLPTPDIDQSVTPVTITAVGETTTVNAEASLGYITVTGNANYNIPAPTVYSIATEVNPEGAGTITATTGAIAGASVTFSVAVSDPDAYALDAVEVAIDGNNQLVSVTDNGDGTYTFTMPDGDVTIYADFTRIPYTVTTSWSPSEGGAIWLNGVNTPQTVSVVNGNQVVFGVSPAQGYNLESLTVTNQTTGQEITPTSSGSNEYTFTMPTANVLITAEFSELYKVSSDWNPSNAGQVVLSQGGQDGYYSSGETVTFTVMTNDGYEIDEIEVYDDDEGDDIVFTQIGTDENGNPRYQFTMPDVDVSIFVHFIDTSVLLSHKVTCVANPAGAGTVLTGNSEDDFLPDEVVRILVRPNYGSTYNGLITAINQTTEQPVQLDSIGIYTAHNGLTYIEYRFTMPEADVIVTAYFDVYTPLQVIEHPDGPVSGGTVTVADELIGTWAAKSYLWAKDQYPQVSNDNVDIPDGTTDYMREVMKLQKEDWDQSNWVILDFSTIPDWNGNYNDVANYADQKIVANSITGVYECQMGLVDLTVINDQFTFDKVQHIIHLNAWPEINTRDQVSLGYPGYLGDPREENTHYNYMYNHYAPSNFWQSYIGGKYGTVPETGAQAPNNPDVRMFFMNPKDREVAQVWGVWMGEMSFLDPYQNKTVSGDVFEVYKTSPSGDINVFGFEGAFWVPQDHGWDYNRMRAGNTDGDYGKPSESNQLLLNNAYLFHAAITTQIIEEIPVKASKRAEREGPEGGNYTPWTHYMVYPLDLGGHSDSVTAIQEVNDPASTQIESIRYYNIMGQESATPFDGINIRVIHYKDGSMHSSKILY